ncbi:MAG: PDZ domain-containing protein [Bacteroidaceae bacterium]|nr:PDZ domain-containing protein [Bacteroidaceae bacterium]
MKRFFLAVIAFCSLLAVQAQSFTINPEMVRKVQAAEFFISHFYVDSLSEGKVVDSAIEGMLKQLDPHSTYIKAKDVERSVENLNGSFEGIGVQFNMIEDTLVVIQPVSGGPSERKGIIAGDRIVLVNDTAIAGVKMSRDEIMRRLRVPKGSKVRLGIIREGVKGINEFEIVRDKIPVHTLDAFYMVDDKTGYVKLSSFGQTTHDEFMTAVNSMKEKGMTRLVLDLQGNGGGYLQSAVEVSNEFLPEGEMIVYTDGRAIQRQEFRANGHGTLKDIEVVVLVDSYTASAAEIVSGAIQDNDRGTIVGRRTFSKGLVQRPFELPDKSVIRLTTAHYYSPSGRCIQKPYKMGGKKEYDDDINQRLKSGELTANFNRFIKGEKVAANERDSVYLREDSLFKSLFPDSLKYKTNHKQRVVYGGGGIMPDVYVPLDTTQYTMLYRQMSAKSCILNTSLKYMDKHRKSLQKTYKTFEDFRSQFEVPQDMMEQLFAETKKAKIDYKEEDLPATLPQVKLTLKGLLARDLWEMSEYYQIVNPETDIYQAGLKVLGIGK